MDTDEPTGVIEIRICSPDGNIWYECSHYVHTGQWLEEQLRKSFELTIKDLIQDWSQGQVHL